jgi:preprotein translocase subunit SecA
MSEEQMLEQQRRRRSAPPTRLRFSAPDAAAGSAGLGVAAGAAAGAGGRRQLPPVPQKPSTVVREGDKVGRNDPCPCGSGKKYKKCCGASAAAG